MSEHQQHIHDHDHNNNNDHHDHDHHDHHVPQPLFLQPQPQPQPQPQIQDYLDHYHDNTPEMFQQQQIITKLQKALCLILFFLIIEIIGGYIAQSLAIWSDAAHLMADMAAIMVALLAAHLGTFPISDKHTFGLKRVESLAALFSTMSLLCISIGLAYEAIRRIYSTIILEHDSNDSNDNNINEGEDITAISSTHVVNGRIMSIIAFIGVLVNIILAYVLGEHHVHLPSDTNECHHDHDHGHGHEHNHSDHNGATDTTTTKESSPPSTATATATSSNHDHSHSHSHANEHNHDHNDHTTTTHTESTPLLVSSSSSTTTAKDYSNRPQDSNGTETNQESKKWKIPFSPQNINLQAAYLHVLGDLAQSATVFIAGIIIWIVPSLTIVDPICTLLFCILVFYSAYGVCCTSIAVLLQQVPSHLNYYHIRDRIAMVEYVQDVHDLHIWSISHRVPALTVHCSITYPMNETDTTTKEQHIHDMVLEKIYEIVRCEFNIIHATIQIQSTNSNCITCVDRLCRPCLDDNDNNGTTTNDATTSIVV
jgi:solute carrier family 30 (zinc transporter), member 2